MSLQADLFDLAKAKEDLKTAGTLVEDTQDRLIASLKREKVTKVEIEKGVLTGTLVSGETVSIDDEKLLASLSPAQRAKVTKTVLDKEKLEAMIALGEIKVAQVTKFTETKPKKEYVLVKGDTKAVEAPPTRMVVKAGPRKRVIKARPIAKAVKQP